MSGEYPSDTPQVETTRVDGIPLLIVSPPPRACDGRLVIWIPFLGGTKETYRDTLHQIAGKGCVAISIDPRLHGDRADGAAQSLYDKVVTEFRAAVWPILGGTVLDVLEVIDWAIEQFDIADVAVGGVSLGGDISLAVAGIDQRVTRVAAVAGSPDWTRPGMTQVGEADKVIVQGEPTYYGRFLYEHLNPLTHRERFTNPSQAILFDVGSRDTHVPAEAAFRFQDALQPDNTRLEIHAHDGDHLDIVQDAQIISRAVEWLTQPA
jgi:uncharacterized protein